MTPKLYLNHPGSVLWSSFFINFTWRKNMILKDPGVEVGSPNRSNIDPKRNSTWEGILASIFVRCCWILEPKLARKTEPRGSWWRLVGGLVQCWSCLRSILDRIRWSLAENGVPGLVWLNAGVLTGHAIINIFDCFDDPCYHNFLINLARWSKRKTKYWK